MVVPRFASQVILFFFCGLALGQTGNPVTPVPAPMTTPAPVTPAPTPLATPAPATTPSPVTPMPTTTPAPVISPPPSVATPAPTPMSDIDLRNQVQIRRQFGLEAYDTVSGLGDKLKNLKIAVIDKGFGPAASRERELPASLFTLVPVYTRELIERAPALGSFTSQLPLDEKVTHGKTMAHLAWAMTGRDMVKAPKFFLLNGNGLTNLSRAVRYCIENRVDIILYSQNWEYGGNFDGRGFINRIVSQATQAGILWVNAAGNYGGRVYNSGISPDRDGWVPMGPEGRGLRIKSRLARNPVRIVLSWNRYAEEETVGTDRDLDLYVYNEAGEIAFKSELKQVVNRPGVDRAANESYVPREIIDESLARNSTNGYYRIKVFARGGSFNGTDKLRISVMSGKAPYYDDTERRMVEPVEFPDATKGGEIMVPADHPEVITVGDRTPVSSKGPTADGRSKPDLILDRSDAEFDDGEGSSGTSNAAAYFAGILAMMKAHKPDLNRADVLRYVSMTRPSALFRPGEAQGIEDLGVAEVRRVQGPVFATIEALLGGDGRVAPIVLAGRYRNNGPYIAALSRSPLMMRRHFTYLPPMDRNPDHYEIYLVSFVDREGVTRVWAYFRDKMRPSGQAEEPWERTLRETPQRFVQVVLAKPAQLPSGDDDQEFPRWSTPTPVVLAPLR